MGKRPETSAGGVAARVGEASANTLIRVLDNALDLGYLNGQDPETAMAAAFDQAGEKAGWRPNEFSSQARS